MIASICWAFVALIFIAAVYDLTNKAINAWKPKPQLTTGESIDVTILTAKVNSLINDMNALKLANGFKAAKAAAGQPG